MWAEKPPGLQPPSDTWGASTMGGSDTWSPRDRPGTNGRGSVGGFVDSLDSGLSPVSACGTTSDHERPASSSPGADLETSLSSLMINNQPGSAGPSPTAGAGGVFVFPPGVPPRRQPPGPGRQGATPPPPGMGMGMGMGMGGPPLGGPARFRGEEQWAPPHMQHPAQQQQQQAAAAAAAAAAAGGGGGPSHHGAYPQLRLNLNLLNSPSPRSSLPSPRGRPPIPSLLSPSALHGGGGGGGGRPPMPSPAGSFHSMQSLSPRYSQSPRYGGGGGGGGHFQHAPAGLPPSGRTTPRAHARSPAMSPDVGMYSPASFMSSPTGSLDDVGFWMEPPGSASPGMRHHGHGHGHGGGDYMASAVEAETKRYSNAIKKLCSAGNISEVFTVLEDMLSRGLTPDIKTVKTIMRTCVKKLAWRRALQLLHTPGLPLDVVVYTMAINTCGKAGEWEQGLRVLREMDEASMRDPSLTPNEVSYGTAISACGKAGRWELALMLLNEVKERGLVLNDVCYGGAIDACGRAGQWQEALKLLHEMTLEGVAPNEVCYNSAISACGKAGEWEKAVALLREMRERGLTPDELNYNSAISACGKAAQWAHAVRLLREMAVQGLTPDVVSYGAAIDACRKAGKYDRGLALLSEMKDVGLAPNEVCYHSAVTACSEAGRWSEALLVLSEMVKQGLKPDAISYNAAVEACAKSGKWDALVLLIQDIGREQGVGLGLLQQEGEEPPPMGPVAVGTDATTLVEAVLNNGVATCAKYGNWELAATLLREMEYRGLPPTSASYSSVVDACARAHAWDMILSVMDSLRTTQGLIPEASSYSAALKACCAKGLWKRAAVLLDEMAQRGYPIDTHIYTLVASKNANGGMPMPNGQGGLASPRDHPGAAAAAAAAVAMRGAHGHHGYAADLERDTGSRGGGRMKPRLVVSTSLDDIAGMTRRSSWAQSPSPRAASLYSPSPTNSSSHGHTHSHSHSRSDGQLRLRVALPDSGPSGVSSTSGTPVGSPRGAPNELGPVAPPSTPQGSPRSAPMHSPLGSMDGSGGLWFGGAASPVHSASATASPPEGNQSSPGDEAQDKEGGDDSNNKPGRGMSSGSISSQGEAEAGGSLFHGSFDSLFSKA